MFEPNQTIESLVCNVITVYSAWEHDEITDEDFDAQITELLNFFNINSNTIADVLEHATIMKFANINNS